MFWYRDLTFYLWLLFSIDYGAIDTLGLVFSVYLDDLGYLPTFYFILKHFTFDTFMLSILLELDHYFLLSHTSHHDTWPHTPLSIKRICRSVLYFFDFTFIHLLDFRFNIFHDGKAWQIVDLLVMMLSFWQLAFWVSICAFCILSTGHHCFYSSISFVLLTWYHDTWSCLALPIQGWTFSLHDGWAYFRTQ